MAEGLSAPRSRGRLARDLFHAVSDRGVQKRALLVAVVVGVILNAINQGDRILAGQSPDVVKLILTHIVPYCVGVYGGATAILGRR
ncbi:nitrate/nitrite transporter NrtS [Methylopila musalis]|uniref:Nitrate/nitrite transporter NrtS n=1 Tax=Methylopila musalis TaxID=1134781 RepID=A0ABW3Z2U9_9HYPH